MTEESKGFGKKRKAKPVQPRLRFNPPTHDPTKNYPSIAQQAKNLAQTAADVARDPRWVDDEEYERRMNICRACNLFDHEQVRCRKCGCRLKGKARFKAGKCPIQKW
jgi:hypothetical protein